MINIACPVELLQLLARPEIPYLDLVGGCVAPCQYPAILEIQGLPRDVWSEEVPHTSLDPGVPKVNHTVPSSRQEYVLVHPFKRENTIGMSQIVPVCRLELVGHRLCA